LIRIFGALTIVLSTRAEAVPGAVLAAGSFIAQLAGDRVPDARPAPNETGRFDPTDFRDRVLDDFATLVRSVSDQAAVRVTERIEQYDPGIESVCNLVSNGEHRTVVPAEGVNVELIGVVLAPRDKADGVTIENDICGIRPCFD
jgi:hypothetical protein